MNELEKAGMELDECWFIFSMTGDVQDARLLMDAIAKYDLLLAQESEFGL